MKIPLITILLLAAAPVLFITGCNDPETPESEPELPDSADDKETKLTAWDGEAYDNFGYALSLSGDYALIGAHRGDDAGIDSGSAYVFHREGTTWTQEAKLTAWDGEAYDYFGRSLSLDGDCVVIGAYAADDYGSSSGAAYVFRRSGTDWPQEDYLTAWDGEANDCFGMQVSLNGGYALIGAYGADDYASFSGVAYAYQLIVP